jgi:hypothetical protein
MLTVEFCLELSPNIFPQTKLMTFLILPLIENIQLFCRRMLTATKVGSSSPPAFSVTQMRQLLSSHRMRSLSAYSNRARQIASETSCFVWAIQQEHPYFCWAWQIWEFEPSQLTARDMTLYDIRQVICNAHTRATSTWHISFVIIGRRPGHFVWRS